MSVTRYFKNIQGIHDKFWNISLQPRAYIVRFGRNGTTGQERVKTFVSDLAARTAFHLKIGEKLGKGYCETTASFGDKLATDIAASLANANAVAIEPKAAMKKKGQPRKRTERESDSLREPKRAISFD